MPRVHRRTRERLGFGEAHVLQLVCKHDYFGDAFGNDEAAHEIMREAWDELKEAAYRMLAARNAGHPARLRPWALWEFETDTESNPRGILAEAVELERLGFLDDHDRALLAKVREAAVKSAARPCISS